MHCSKLRALLGRPDNDVTRAIRRMPNGAREFVLPPSQARRSCGSGAVAEASKGVGEIAVLVHGTILDIEFCLEPV